MNGALHSEPQALYFLVPVTPQVRIMMFTTGLSITKIMTEMVSSTKIMLTEVMMMLMDKSTRIG